MIFMCHIRCLDLICIFYVMLFSFLCLAIIVFFIYFHFHLLCFSHHFLLVLHAFSLPWVIHKISNSPFHLLLFFLANAQFVIEVLNAKDAFFTTAMFIAQVSAKRMLTECIALASLVCHCTPLFFVLRQLCLRWMSSIRLL